MGLSNCGYGTGDDYGSGFGDGDGDGDGYGHSSGTGSGLGSGFGDGDGSGYGFVVGSGVGYGLGSGYGSGNGYGYDFGSGFGVGYGRVYGVGSGSGSRNIKISIPEKNKFKCFHYIKKKKDKYITRTNQKVKLGDILVEDKVELCYCGLHASIKAKEAEIYAPENSVLTEVYVWGDVVFGDDKLVATYRQIIREVKEN